MKSKNKEPAAKKPPAAENSCRGSITIYLMLVLVIILVLICTLVESGRVSAVSMRVRSLTYMGMDSVFSEYAKSIFEDYGIMVLWKDEDDFLSEFEEYVQANLDVSDLSYSGTTSFYGISLSDVSLSSAEYITDDGGLIFAQQVYEYMEYYLAKEAAESLLESLNIFGQGDIVSSFVEKIESYSDVFTEVEEKVSAVKDAVVKAKQITSSPENILSELFDLAASYSEGEDTSSDFSSALKELKSVKSSIEDALLDIQDATDEYYTSTEKAAEAASELEESLLEEADDLDEDIYESIKGQIDELSEKSADTQADYYGVAENERTVKEYLTELESLEELFKDLDEDLNEENAEEYMALAQKYQEIFSNFDLESLGVNFDAESIEQEDSSILDYISNLIDKGVLAYVKDDISEKTIETDNLPSVTVDSSSGDSQENIAQATANKVIFGEYILGHFGNAVDALEDTALDYEVEYIIAGKSSDLANLKVVTAEIVSLRSALNFISILQDSVKKQEAYALASAMVGFTGMPLLITAVQMLILTAWSMAEAVTDVKSLFEGEKVPTIKTSSQWNLSIEGFKNFTGKDLETASYDTGLEYEDYLRVLLAMQGKQKQYYRTMDVIQANVNVNENADFEMAGCISAAGVEAQYIIPELFTSISWVKSSLALSGSGYSFVLTQEYEY